MKIKPLLMVLLTFFWSVHLLMANGYQVNLQGTRQIGMGNVGIGLWPDATAVFFNPGGMSYLGSSQIMIGISPILGGSVFLAPSDPANGIYSNAKFRTDNPVGTPFFAYGVYRPDRDSGIFSKLTFGLGAFTPFGSTVDWEDGWYGQFALEQIELQSIFVRPTVSWQVTDRLSIGAGVDFIFGSVNLQRALPVDGPVDSMVELDGNADLGVSFSVGAFVKASDLISFGLTYRHGIDLSVKKGDVTFVAPDGLVSNNYNPDTYNPSDPSQTFFSGTQFDATLPLPTVVGFGMGVYPTDRLTLAFDVQYINWSAYKELKFDFTQPVQGSFESVARRNYEDSWIFNFGGEYEVIQDRFTARAGFYYDLSPVRDGYITPETPDANALGLTAGVTFNFNEHIGVDLAYLFINKEERHNTVPAGVETSGINGTYKSRAHIPSIAVHYSF
ncbi:outer membrane protein transport protein [Limibacter armeniacum]|uniref:OmpP1/FadL family transporter n=1 Tax=Limibacter armeniacum TaxID=466084 RepID=UPI002FE5A131